jgi:hypothetical protein
MKNNTAIEWFSNELTNIERENFINKRILPLSRNSLASLKYEKLLNLAKELEAKKAEKYAKFCLECYFNDLPIIGFEDWINLKH